MSKMEPNTRVGTYLRDSRQQHNHEDLSRLVPLCVIEGSLELPERSDVFGVSRQLD